MRAVLYLRYSSDRQTEQSIEGQRAVCGEYADRNGIEIVREYVDRATSASKNIEKRLAFLDMIADSKDKNFDIVLVYKLDRFSRDRYEEAIYKHRLLQNGVKVVSATENIPDDPSGIILSSIISGMNEYYSAELSQKVRRGMQQSANKCLFKGGSVPYGYNIVDKKYVVDESKRKYVEQAFLMIAEGKTIKQVIAMLNDNEQKTYNGKEISNRMVGKMLRNKNYCGYYTYKAGNLSIKDGIPAIITEDLFNKVQESLESNKTNSRIGTGKTRIRGLVGKVYCGTCGERAKATHTRKANGTRYFYFTCENKCFAPVNRDMIEDMVFVDLQEWFTQEKIEAMALGILESLRQKNENKGYLDELYEKKKALKNKFDKVLHIYLEKDIEGLDDQLKDIDNKIKDVDAEIAKCEEAIDPRTEAIKFDALIKFMKAALIEEADAPNFRQRMFDVLVNKVYVFDDRIACFYNIDDSHKDITFEDFKSSSMFSQSPPERHQIEHMVDLIGNYYIISVLPIIKKRKQ